MDRKIHHSQLKSQPSAPPVPSSPNVYLIRSIYPFNVLCVRFCYPLFCVFILNSICLLICIFSFDLFAFFMYLFVSLTPPDTKSIESIYFFLLELPLAFVAFFCVFIVFYVSRSLWFLFHHFPFGSSAVALCCSDRCNPHPSFVTM